MNTPAFQIGDSAWVARAHTVDKWIQCPACCGKKALTVIMGDDSHVSIDCSLCAVGYNPPRGGVLEYAFECRAEPIIIERIEQASDGTLEYNYSKDVLATHKEAMVRAEVIGKQYAQEQRERMEWRKEHEQHTWSWNAAYHRQKLKEAQRQIEYHTAKLNVAKAKAKEPDPVATTPPSNLSET